MGSPSSERNSRMIDTSEGLKSDQEVVEELTKDLESSCIRIGESSVSNDNTKSRIDSCESVEPNSDDDNDINSKTDSARDANAPKDFVDEESLKDREVTLSESEKQVCICLSGSTCTPAILTSKTISLCSFHFPDIEKRSRKT